MLKVSKVYNEKVGHGVKVETSTGFINHMWFDNEPNLDDSEWLDYIHEETRFKEEMWVQAGKFKPTEANDTTE